MPTLYDCFLDSGNRLLDEREARYKRVDTPERVHALQQELRAVAREVFGSYVLDRAGTDAPPAVLRSGVVEVGGVVIEKFLYEAFADFWVPALLYRPARDLGRCPALVMPVGHWWEGKALPMYQRLMRLLARRGVICATFDACGQGERIPWVNTAIRDAMRRLAEAHPAGEPRPYPLQGAPTHGFWAANNVTSAHCIIGEPGYLCGVHQHALTAVAGKRLLDLLVSRPDVIAEKIGACGASGGGTDTRLLAALDERLALAVPVSIVSSDRALSGGDADQSLFGTVNRGISPNDLLICVAPKPLFIIATSEDKHDTAKVASFYRPFWNVFGKGCLIASAVAQGEHGFSHECRRMVAEFVLRHLRGEAHTIPDAEHADHLPVCSERELWTTFTGNVHLDGLGKGPFDLIRERTAALARQRPPLQGASLRAAVLKTLGETEESLRRAPRNVRTTGAEIVWEGEGCVPLRLVWSGAGESVALLVHEDGSTGAEHSPLFSALSRTRLRVARVDLRGTGVSATPEPEPNSVFLAPLLQGKQADLARLVLHQGRTLSGLRTADLLQAAHVLSTTAAAEEIDLIAEGGIGFAALLAAALEPGVFRRVVLFRTPLSWSELTTSAGRVWNFAHFLPGVLEHFDTPDLTRALPPHKVLWLNPTDGTGAALPLERAASEHGNVTFKLARVESELVQALTR
ncbi:MAG: hypothetical protein NTW87_15325 [Planctomycetota bacterium]|nr:hypothetical protein [Planctomycetota bacterium]